MFLTGSKVGLGTPWRRIRELLGPPLGLESCWGFAVSHASRCRGCGNSVCIGFERWMKHTSRGSGPSVFNGFEGRVRHTLGLNPAGVSLFRMHRPLHVLGALKFKPTEAEAASVPQRFEGRVRHTVVFRRFGRAAEGAVIVSV